MCYLLTAPHETLFWTPYGAIQLLKIQSLPINKSCLWRSMNLLDQQKVTKTIIIPNRIWTEFAWLQINTSLSHSHDQTEHLSVKSEPNIHILLCIQYKKVFSHNDKSNFKASTKSRPGGSIPGWLVPRHWVPYCCLPDVHCHWCVKDRKRVVLIFDILHTHTKKSMISWEAHSWPCCTIYPLQECKRYGL